MRRDARSVAVESLRWGLLPALAITLFAATSPHAAVRAVKRPAPADSVAWVFLARVSGKSTPDTMGFESWIRREDGMRGRMLMKHDNGYGPWQQYELTWGDDGRAAEIHWGMHGMVTLFPKPPVTAHFTRDGDRATVVRWMLLGPDSSRSDTATVTLDRWDVPIPTMGASCVAHEILGRFARLAEADSMRWFDINAPIGDGDGTPWQPGPALSTRLLNGKPVNPVDAHGRLTETEIGDGFDVLKWVRIPYAALPPERFPNPRRE